MMFKQFGKTGRKVSEIGMGTYYDPLWIATGYFGWRRGERRKLAALRTGLESGLSLIDTAEIYQSEPIVAKALDGRRRDELFVATKVWSNHLHRDDLVKAFERSLRRLGLKYLDLYQIHWPNPNVPMEETMSAMDSLVKEGKLLHIGVSNFNLRQLEEANSVLPKSEVSSVQVNYSLLRREIESDILPYCQKQGLALLAYYPLGHGKLVRSPLLDGVARRTKMTKSQISLAWLARKDSVIPIPRASESGHVRENAGVQSSMLAASDVAELEGSFPRVL